MGYTVVQQIEKGRYRLCAKTPHSGNKELKRQRNRKQRRKIKADLEYVPHYNRYAGWDL